MVKIDAFHFLLIIEVGLVCLAWALYVSYKARKYRKMLLWESLHKVEPKEHRPGRKENRNRLLEALEVAEKRDPGPEEMGKEGAPVPVSSEEKEQLMEKVRRLEKEVSEKGHSLEEARKRNETLENQLSEMNKRLEAMKKQYSVLEKEYSVLYSLEKEKK